MTNTIIKSSVATSSRSLLVALFAVLFSFGFTHKARACSPLAVPNLLNQTIVGNFLVLDWESTNVWACNGYSVEVQIVCTGAQFPNSGNSLLSPNLNKTVVTNQAVPTMSIDLTAFCPGQIYQFRAREVHGSVNNFSGWTSTFTFTTPGVPITPTLAPFASSNVYCPPQTPTLNAGLMNPCGSPVSFVWTPTAGLSSPFSSTTVAQPTVTTIYTITSNGGPFSCWSLTSTLAIGVNVSDPPFVGQVVANPSIVCAGLNTTLTVSSFTGILVWQSAANGSGPWTNVGGGTATLVTNPLFATTTCFRALVSTCTGTVSSNIVCVNANQTPTLNPTVIHPTCSNTVASVNLNNPGSSGNPITASWTPGPTTVGPNSTTATFAQLFGVVQVTLTFADGCISKTTFTINPIPPTPVFTIVSVVGGASITCATPTVVLNAATNYTLNQPNFTWSSSSFNSSAQQVSLTTAGNYSILVNDPVTGCQSQQTIAIGLNVTPPQSSVGPITQNIVCGSGSVPQATGCAISPSINVTHTWFSPISSAPPVSGGGNCSFYEPAVGTTTYVLTDNVNGCTTTKTIEVGSNQGFPTFSLFSNRSFTVGCATRSLTDISIVNPNTTPPGGSPNFTLLAPGFTGNYTVNGTPDFTVSTPGNYTVVVRDMFNLCETRITIPVVQDVVPPNLLVTSLTRTLTCRTPSVTLEGSSSTDPAIPLNYLWSFQNGSNPNSVPNFSIPVAINNNTALTGTVINTYTLQITNLNNECKTTSVVPMYQNIRPPLAKINGAGALDCIVKLQTLVNGSSLNNAPAFPPLMGTQAVRWEGPTPQEPKDSVASYEAKTVGTYTMFVMDRNNGCVTFTTATVADNRIYPVLSGEENQFLDCGNASLVLRPSYIPSVGLTYNWIAETGVVVSNPSLSSLAVTEPGEYRIVAVNSSNGCGSVKQYSVKNGTLTGGFEADAYEGFAPLTVNFTNLSASTSSSSGSSSITTVWSYGNGTSRTTTTSVGTSATYLQPGTYTVTMFAHKGACSDTVYKVIVVDIPSKMEVPNVFTPNGDNNNDIFFIKVANLTEITAIIYDRWGNKVYELTTDKGNIAWDGKNMTGKEAPEGTYFYIITAKGKDGVTFDKKGNVSLFR